MALTIKHIHEEIFMKRTKLFAAGAALALIVGLALLSCSNDSDEKKEETIADTQDNAVAAEDIAFNLLRELCDLKNDNGDEELPSDWKTKTFTADIGTSFPTDVESDSTVRYVACENADDAAEYFHELIGSESDSWSDADAGEFTFEKAGNANSDEDLFATLTVKSNRVSGLSLLKFYSEDGIKDSVGTNAVNPTYYHAGDIVTRDSDGTTWICVKPAGGPSNDSSSYWMCLDPFAKSGKNAGKCIIKEDKKKVWLSYANLIQKNWVYAKNLMSLDTAKAAYHTFNALLNGNGTNAQTVYSAIANLGYNIANLSNNGENFCFAFGSPKNDKNRVSRGNSGINSQTTYVQPFFIGKVGAADSIQATSDGYSSVQGAATMLAVTDSYDRNYLDSFYTDFLCYILKMSTNVDDGYTYLDYIHSVTETDGTKTLGFTGTYTWMSNKKTENPKYASFKSYPYHIIYSPEIVIKDTGSKVNGYTEVYISGDNAFDYWGAL